MKLLLVQPPLTMSPEVHPPLGLCALAAHLQREGHAVRILDLDLEVKPPAGADPAGYLTTFVEALERERPALVGVTSMFNNSLHAEQLIRAAKAFDSGVVTVAGGSHFGALPHESLARIPELDFVIRGEGEAALAQLVACLESGDEPYAIPRLCFRTPEGISENLEAPLLDLKRIAPTWMSLGDTIELSRYVATIPAGAPRKAVYIEAGRGCPFACSFCATSPFWQRRYRVKPVEMIVAEIRYLHQTFGYDTFFLVHDLLTVNRRFMDEFCAAMFAAALPVEWTANHRADIPLGDLRYKMRSAGCLSVFMGIETASARLQSDIDKGLARSQIISTVSELREVGITSTCSFIVGFPTETVDELSATLGLAAELKLLGAEPVQVHRLRRWPPAPLAALDGPAFFDLDALRLEFPAPVIPEEAVDAIAADPAFFMGYFTPSSTAGNALQLAQLELFFAHMLAVMPITTAVLAALYGSELASAFYRVLDVAGPLAREDLDTAPAVSATLTPFLERWVAQDDRLEHWQRALLRGTVAYERVRTAFITRADAAIEEPLAGGVNWAVFPVEVDVPRLLSRLAAGDPVTADLCLAGRVALSRRDDGSARCFALSNQFAERLRDGDARAINALASG